MEFPPHRTTSNTVLSIIIICLVGTGVASQEQMAAALTPYECEMGTCQNGIFSMTTCGCQCIPPYCPDLIGDCTQPTNSCGGNPWTECVKGVDCREYNVSLLQYLVLLFVYLRRPTFTHLI
jgi:hypothetical protein